MPIGRVWPREDLAWAAGFFEGEGTVVFNKALPRSAGRKYTHGKAVRLSANQIYREPLDKLREILQLGRVLGPHQRYSGSALYVWQVTKFAEVQAVLALLWSWLSPRRKAQASKVLLTYKEA